MYHYKIDYNTSNTYGFLVLILSHIWYINPNRICFNLHKMHSLPKYHLFNVCLLLSVAYQFLNWLTSPENVHYFYESDAMEYDWVYEPVARLNPNNDSKVEPHIYTKRQIYNSKQVRWKSHFCRHKTISKITRSGFSCALLLWNHKQYI